MCSSLTEPVVSSLHGTHMLLIRSHVVSHDCVCVAQLGWVIVMSLLSGVFADEEEADKGEGCCHSACSTAGCIEAAACGSMCKLCASQPEPVSGKSLIAGVHEKKHIKLQPPFNSPIQNSSA